MRYKSEGTIRYKAREGNIRAVFFVPDNDYSIKHAHKRYAVFAPSACDCASGSCGCTSSRSCDCAIIVKYDPDGNCGVKIYADQKWDQILSNAVTHQTKLEILVNVRVSKMTELVEKVGAAGGAKAAAEEAAEEAAAAEETAAAAEEAAMAAGEAEEVVAAARAAAATAAARAAEVAEAAEAGAAARAADAAKAAAGLKKRLWLVGITFPAK